MPLRILVVEDEPLMAALLSRGLHAEGYAVDIADNGIDAITLSKDTSYDLAILDVMLPGMSGFELCRRLREQTHGIAILLLTARDAVDDRVRGLDAGADDYLTKPFMFAELAARLRALRRRDAIGATRIDIGGVRIDMTRHEITCDGKELRLSRTEFDLLRLLAENMGRVLPRTEMLESLWGSSAHINANILDQYVSYVRKKLDTVGAPLRIVNSRGIGFQLAADKI
ncbi:response regulator transcription factor [Marisediminicola antarctica]|uniref:response regulator transcription factor n=1 Tax=Marisediminicola antarctica TaxID=674079 RepID=UPI001F4542DA|nr:response regulator transcription factor [Marisediminicola antarctica]